jgi:hypothetical protein
MELCSVTLRNMECLCVISRQETCGSLPSTSYTWEFVACGAMKVPTNVTSWGSNVEAIRVLALFGSNSVRPAGKQQPQHFGIGLHGIPVRLAGAPGGL